MKRLPWRHGASASWNGPVTVSATRFTYKSLRTMPFVLWHGLKLRAGWPKIDGAIGVSIALDLATRTTYTMKAWRSPEHLKAWVRSPAHAPLMRNYRSRLRSSAADTWQAETFDLRKAWREAMMRVGLQSIMPKAEASAARRPGQRR